MAGNETRHAVNWGNKLPSGSVAVATGGFDHSSAIWVSLPIRNVRRKLVQIVSLSRYECFHSISAAGADAEEKLLNQAATRAPCSQRSETGRQQYPFSKNLGNAEHTPAVRRKRSSFTFVGVAILNPLHKIPHPPPHPIVNRQINQQHTPVRKQNAKVYGSRMV